VTLRNSWRVAGATASIDLPVSRPRDAGRPGRDARRLTPERPKTPQGPVDWGWATKTDGRYELTTTGGTVVEEHTTYLEVLDRIDAFSPLFRHPPDSDHTPELRWLQDATLRSATEQHPQAPVEFYIERVRAFDGDRVRMIAPVLSRLFHRAHADLAFDGVRARSLGVDDRRSTRTEPDGVRRRHQRRRPHGVRVPDDIEFGLTLGDDRLLIGAYDGDGQLRACIESTDPDCYQWAERLFDRYVEQSTTIDSPFSVPFPRRRSKRSRDTPLQV